MSYAGKWSAAVITVETILEKQKEGKKNMKMIGKVEIPKEAFVTLFNKK
jgi:translation elongation factor EF-4